MTVSTEVLSNQYAGNGSTDEFDFDFMVYDESELVVRLIDSDGNATLQTEGVHYTVDGVGTATGGSVTFTEAPASGITVDLRPIYSLVQSASIRNQGRFLPEIHETVFDRLTRFQQYVYRLAQQSLRLPDHGTLQSGELADLAARKGTYLYFDEETGEPTHAINIGTTPLTQPIFDGFLEDAQQSTLAPILNPRSASELAALVTPSNYNYLSAEALGGMFRYGAAGNYTAPGVGTDDTSALRRAFLVIQARGGGVIDLGSRRYRLYSDGSTTPLGDLSSIRGLTIKSDGAELVIDRTFSGSQVVQGLIFTACDGIKFSGHIKVTCTQTQPAGQKTSRGFEFASFYQGCTNVSSDVATFNSIRVGWYMRRALGDPASYISRGFDLGVTHATFVGYPLTTAGATGHDLTAALVTNTCGRSYFPQGAINHKVSVTSTDAEASVDCLIASVGTIGIDNLELAYTNTTSTIADNSRDGVRLEIQDSDVYDVINRNIKIKLNILTGGSTYIGFGFSIGKVKADSTADAVDRGHRIENVEITGTIDASNINQRGIGFCSFGTWSTGEFIRNIQFKDLRLVGIAQPTFNLASLQDRAVFSNVYCSAQMNVTGNTISTITMMGVDCGGSITSSTADTSRVVYIGCNFGSLTNQSVVNKKFYGCDGLGNQYTGTGTGFSGAAPTGNINYTIQGDVVVLDIANIQGTSNTTSCTFTGMPVQIRPASSQIKVARIQDNGAQQAAWLLRVETSGVLTLLNLAGSTTGFTASGTKGIGQQTISYRMS